MLKVGFTGLPGSGKTTIVRRLSSELSSNYRVELIDEFAREYISNFGNIHSVAEQVIITDKQIEKENGKNADILITDSPVLLSFYYANDYSKENNKDNFYVSELFKKIKQWHLSSPYKIIFHIEPTIRPREDGIRPDIHFDETWRDNANIVIKALPLLFKVQNSYILQNNNLDETIKFCIEKIKELKNARF